MILYHIDMSSYYLDMNSYYVVMNSIQFDMFHIKRNIEKPIWRPLLRWETSIEDRSKDSLALL